MKNGNYLKLSAALISVLSALSILLCSCGNVTDPGITSTSVQNDDSSSAVPTEQQTEEETLPLLDVKNYGGETFNVIWPEVHGDGHFVHNELWSDGSDGDIINSAVFSRNAKVETDYGIKINCKLVWCSSITGEVDKSIAVGDADWDAYAGPVKMMSSAALAGKCLDYLSLPYYSDEMPWWDGRVMEGFEIAGKRFFGAGDVIYSDNFYPFTVFANLDLFNDYYPAQSLFSLVKKNEWTFDKLIELCKPVPVSSDDNWNYEDKYGIIVSSSFAKAAYYASGRTVTENDADGYPQITMTLEGAQEVLEKMVTLFHTNHIAYDSDESQSKNMPGMTSAQTDNRMFSSDQALFFGAELITAERLTVSDSDVTFGVFPVPKFSSDQDGYVCVMNDAVVVCIPSNADPEKSSLILSALGRESMTTLTPAFYDLVLTYRYMRNAESIEMLDIILASVRPKNLGDILEWGTLMSRLTTLVSKGSTDFASEFATGSKIAETEIKKFKRTVDFLRK
ncbi:MAG: hypothetical protein J5592_09120 [Clostridia bacterium]|nr:hypothetical protein [Clostridia bacterium]